jgi:hypothetical protein
VDLMQVQAFLVLADELHFGRAAERVGLSQPRVSLLDAINPPRTPSGRPVRRTRAVSGWLPPVLDADRAGSPLHGGAEAACPETRRYRLPSRPWAT